MGFQTIENILETDDLNDSLGDIQDIINQDAGDDAGVFFSDYDDINDEWSDFSHQKKNKILLDYIKYEKEITKTYPDREQSIETEQLEILEAIFLYINGKVNSKDLELLDFKDYHIDFLNKKIEEYKLKDALNSVNI